MIPRALASDGALGGLVTDVWSGKWGSALSPLAPTTSLKAALSRYHPDLQHATVRTVGLTTFTSALRRSWARQSSLGRYDSYCQAGSHFAQAAAAVMLRERWVGPGKVFFGYDTCSLETMAVAKNHGVRCLLGQTDPSRTEVQIVQEEEKDWPTWVSEPLRVPESFFDRHVDEWEIADKIIVNSSHSRDSLVAQGVPSKKLAIIPLAYDVPQRDRGCSRYPTLYSSELISRSRPLRVLYLGQVMLRKGIQYLMAAAKKLINCPVQFDIVGPIFISSDAVRTAPSNVVFHGRVDRLGAKAWYQSADIFVLPTLSDGFALTQLEAMAYGLPVIATRNCGEVVVDGVNGLLVEPRNVGQLVSAIEQYLDDPDKRDVQSKAAYETLDLFNKENLFERLVVLGSSKSDPL